MDEAIRVYLPRKEFAVERICDDWDDVDDWDHAANTPKPEAEEVSISEKTAEYGKHIAQGVSDGLQDRSNERSIHCGFVDMSDDFTIIHTSEPEHARPVRIRKEAKLPSKWESRLETLKEVLAKQEKKEDGLRWRHPWVSIIYNWVIVALVVALGVSLWTWGARVIKERKEAKIYATAYAEYEAAAQSEREAEEAAKAEALAAELASEEYIVGEMTSALSRMYYGIKNFEEKYHYSDADFETYGRCAYNRMLNGSYSDDFTEVVFQPEQFLSCSQSNPDVEPYHSMAKKHIEKWRSETVAPVSDDFVYAELTPNGVYLKNEFNADGYARRWRAGT